MIFPTYQEVLLEVPGGGVGNTVASDAALELGSTVAGPVLRAVVRTACRGRLGQLPCLRRARLG